MLDVVDDGGVVGVGTGGLDSLVTLGVCSNVPAYILAKSS